MAIRGITTSTRIRSITHFQRGYRVYFAFPPRSYHRLWLFSLLTLFEFWDKHPSRQNWTKLVFYLVCFKGMLCHHVCLLNAGLYNADVLSCWLVWFAQIPFSGCQCLFRSHNWTDPRLNALSALTEKHQQVCFVWKRFLHILVWKQTVGFVECVKALYTPALHYLI